MRIGLITTLDTNIGDDFIRLGIQRVLMSLWPNQAIQWVCVNKHRPETVWPIWHPMRYLPAWAPNYRELALKLPANRFAGCDLIVQCGAPVIWDKCYRCEWHGPLWTEVIGPLHKKIPVLNLAAGSAFDLANPPKRVPLPEDCAFLSEILSYCRLTTARDPLAKTLFEGLGVETPLLPCTAGLAFEPAKIPSQENILYVNYMPRAGHFDFSKNLSEENWTQTVLIVLRLAAQKFQIVFLCHNAAEMELAARLFPDYPRLLPKNADEYAAIARRARLGFFNRLHAAVSFAGVGVPSVTVGNDTRALMVREYGIPVLDVRDATPDAIWSALLDLDNRRIAEQQRLLDLRRQTFDRYRFEIRQVLSL